MRPRRFHPHPRADPIRGNSVPEDCTRIPQSPNSNQSKGRIIMETHPEMFPPDRRTDPKRRAEARVFDEIQNSRLAGFAHYEWQRDHRSPQLDFAVWLPEVGRFGLQVKGGHYSLQNGKWYLRTGNGSEKKDSPLQKTWDATMSLHDDVVEILEYEAFFIAVLVFPDMEFDQAIAAKARRTNVHVIWGVDGLVDRLKEIATVTEVYNPPDAEDIGQEVAAVTDNQVLYEPPGNEQDRHGDNPVLPEVPPGTRLDIAAGSVTIQHVDTLIVHTAPGWNPDAGHPSPLNRGGGDETTAGE